MAFGARVLARIGVRADADPKTIQEFANLEKTLISSLDELHWDARRQKYADYGEHCNDGTYEPHIVVKCGSIDGRQIEHTIDKRKFRQGRGAKPCPPEFPDFLFPLGDGKGGYRTSAAVRVQFCVRFTFETSPF